MRKPLFLVLVCVFFADSGFAQSLFSEIRKSISVEHPEVDFNDHLLAFSVWSTEDKDSRILNKEIERTYSVYRQARLKGGSKGLIVVLYNKENLASSAVIALQKDGVLQSFSLPLSALTADLLRRQDSGLFDAVGNTVSTDLTAETFYSLIQGLITR
jgi:hypothetical protein